MRYLIETKKEDGSVGAQLAKLKKSGKIDIIEKGDPIEEIKIAVLKIGKAFKTLKKAGISEDVMVAYIRSKGVSLKNITDVLHYQKEFLKKLGVV